MGSEPNEQQKVEARAISEAAGYVRDTIKYFTDDGRKRVLDQALEMLESKLVVQHSDIS
jgi:hypothetical protein